MRRAILSFFLLGCSQIVSAKDGQLCLNYDDDQRFCSSETFPNGKELSEFLSAVLSVPVNRNGQQEIIPQSTEPMPPTEGIFKLNTKLDERSSKVFENWNGPESITREGDYFYGAATDAIYRVNVKTGETTKVYDGNANCSSTTPCSRPLGIRIKNGKIYCADMVAGVIEIDTNNGQSKILLPPGTLVSGTKVQFTDDLDVDWENGFIYISDITLKWPFNLGLISLLEVSKDGRILRYNLNTNEVDVLADKLHFPNGVQISHDKSSLLVNEFTNKRVVRIPLKGPYPAQATPFTQTFPGYPDNIRPSKSGGYWVVCYMYSEGKPSLLDEFAKNKKLAKRIGDWLVTAAETIEVLGKLSNSNETPAAGVDLVSKIIWSLPPKSTAALEIDSQGQVLQVLQSKEHKKFTEPFEDDDALYLGSFDNHYVLKVPRENYRK